ncbi:bifunctional 3,4-dihydroxy-2-butanone-4-phosphate synthase/GTP cyclohydrolase II [Thiomicrorhabdus arctica]|jgi:3,4-dihydroxy 2-butanone 4-phosphate synthase/GTP cyclohydrolase II|uniref:bifunctional 3,4-dihydroxy-2-butanone-4-phosphate synthase/GTP cyclohydrolase II n=1 Tax=Thiomicrorhabdus arctica TaxID=131540 RepID=UPI00037CB660|nr:bifunctional 3,4-dihydroxy-2-butanone-4-phosphate synthase/GTP cyclohydrolase II [Thiomicrorhabdus arctica]
MQLNTIEELIEDYKQGKMVILMDDEDRENEGDLLIPSSMVTAADINFMARYGRGLICLTMTRERCHQLHLPLMVKDNSDPHGTPFTVSIEAAEGVTTGISAADRAVTVRAAVADNAGPADIVTPGHIFPLMAQPGGVLTRAGHTEAGCDLARLAGMEASSVIVEIMNEDGSMARRDDLEEYAQLHKLKIGTIADLIEYRLQNEKTIERVSECKLPTEFGDFKLMGYQDILEHKAHFALVFGSLQSETPTVVRVHMLDTLCDVFGSNRPECGWPLRSAMKQIAEAGSGVIVVLRKREEASELLDKIQAFQMKDLGVHVPDTAYDDDTKTYGLGAQILSDLGLKKLKVIGSSLKMNALSGFGLEISEIIPKKD